MNRKVNLFMALVGLLVVTSFVSCSKESTGSEDENITEAISSNINTKWLISDVNSPYASFEFNEDGNYIVAMNEAGVKAKENGIAKLSTLFHQHKISLKASSNLSPVHFGKYTIDGDKIILSGFGTIEVISITAEEFTFSFTLESTGEKGNYVAGKTEETVSVSSRTDMFCRTWILKQSTIDENSMTDGDIDYYKEKYGSGWKAEIEQEENEEMAGITVLFSKVGTYLVLYHGEDAGLSEWKWANKEETAFYYSWDNWEDNWENHPVLINKLSKTSLIMQENYWVYELILAE